MLCGNHLKPFNIYMFCSYNGIITADNLDESGYVVIHQGAGLLKTLCISIFCVSLNKKKVQCIRPRL